MRRRTVLAAVLGGLAGCGQRGDSPPGVTSEVSDTPSATDSTSPSTRGTQSPTGETPATAEPTIPPVAGSRFESVPCPSVDGEPTTCYHTLPEGRPSEVYLVPSSETVKRPDGSIVFTLVNNTEEPVDAATADPLLLKRMHGRWYEVSPVYYDLPSYTTLSPERTARVGVSLPGASLPAGAQTLPGIALGGTGLYALYVDLAGALALFEVQGNNLQLSADDVVDTSIDGGTLTLETLESEQRAAPNRVDLIPERDDESAVPVIPELAIQSHPLRNGLPFVGREDIDRVRVLTPEFPSRTREFLRAVHDDPTDPDDGMPENPRYEYRGTTFRVELSAGDR